MAETPENRQYVACSFNSGGRQYTYHYDGPERLEAGMIADAGHQNVRIERVVPEAPSFATKPLTRIFPSPDPEKTEADGVTDRA